MSVSLFGNSADAGENRFGQGNLDEKEEAIEAEKEKGISVDEARDAAIEFIADVYNLGSVAAKAIRGAMVPGFWQRYKNKKIYENEMHIVDREIDATTHKIKKTITKEHKHHLASKAKAVRRQEAIERKAHLRVEVKQALTEAVKVAAEAEVEDYLHRRELQRLEAEAKLAAEAAEQARAAAQADKQMRTWRVQHWGSLAKEWRQEAHQNKADQLNRLETEYETKLGLIQDEWTDRELAKLRMQVEGPRYGDGLDDPFAVSTTGLFGEHATKSPTKADRVSVGHVSKEDIDDDAGVRSSSLNNIEVHLFDSSHASVGFEEQALTGHRMKSETLRLQQLYSSLQASHKEMDSALQRLSQVAESINADLSQVNSEHVVATRVQLGPPRRLPIPSDVQSTHARKSRIKALEKQMKEVSHTMEVVSAKRDICETQLLAVARELAVSKEQLKQTKEEIDSVNNVPGSDGALGQLPVVVGTSLLKQPGMELLGAPKELMNAVIHKSKSIEFAAMKDNVLKVHKESVELDQKLWVERQGAHEIRADGERVLNRFAEISEKLKTSHYERMKLNLIDSLKLFFQRNVKLKPVHNIISGPLHWFRHHNTQLSSNIISYASSNMTGIITFEPSEAGVSTHASHDEYKEVDPQGVTLGAASQGVCVGVIRLPKLGLWSLRIPISRQGKGKVYGGDDYAHVTVKMGPSLSSLSLVGDFGNLEDEDTGEVVHDCLHVFRGEIIVYRFEFFASGKYANDVLKHLAVGVGVFEERQMLPLEVHPDRDSKGREKVISSLVRTLRLEEKQGKLRETVLLEELIRLEEADPLKHRMWDSALLNDTMQRYNREYFMRLLKAEILMEHSKNMSVYNETQAAMNHKHRHHKDDNEVDAESRLKQSSVNYIARVRAIQQQLVERGLSLCDRRLEIYDKAQDKWRHVLVTHVAVSWIENGTKAKLLYTVQEFNDEHELIGNEFEVDLTKVRYFDSATQVVDEGVIRRNRQHKQWELRLKEINASEAARIQEVRQALEAYVDRENTMLKAHETGLLDDFREKCDADAAAALENPINERTYNNIVSVCLIDIKKGVLKIDVNSELKPSEQAHVFAKERFKQQWIDKQLSSINQAVEAYTAKMNRRIAKFENECGLLIKKVKKESSGERYRLELSIKEKRDADKARLQKRLRFDPKLFKRALPTAARCEHIRAKCWGTDYAIGIRCLSCGKELSNLFQEESQLLGYGTGTDPEMYEDIKRHRQNEQAFRFKTSHQLQMVEKERNRLEKERYELGLEDSHFYDFSDLTVLYKFDRRHAKEIKKTGVFRQGLQWTPEELESFELSRVKDERVRLAEQQLVEQANITNFDPLAIVQDPPPTFRGYDERKHAQYKQLIFSMGRLQNFQKRVAALKEERLQLLSDRSTFSMVLACLHKDSYGFDFELTGIEEDLDKTGKLLVTYNKMKELWEKANRNLARAQRELKRAQMAFVGVWDDASECKDALSFIHDEMKELLKQKVLLESKLGAQVSLLNGRREMLKHKTEQWVRAENDRSGACYRMPGEPVLTRFGYGYIRVYRAHDDMCLISLPFGTPSARLWMTGKEITSQERSRQHSERVLMGKEDEAMHRFFSLEKTQSKRERFQMAKEEEGMKEFWEFRDLGKYSDETVTKYVDEAVNTSFQISLTKRFRMANKKRLAKNLKDFIANIKEEAKTYEGPPSGKPKVPNFFAMRKKKQELADELQMTYIESAARKAEASVETSLEVMRMQWIQSHSFEILMNFTVGEMIKEVADECVTEGRVAKIAIEKVSGIYFPLPVWMQHGSYAQLSSIWKQRKAELKALIDQNMGQANRQKASKERPVLDEKQLAKIAAEKRRRREERKRQARLNEEMAQEEARCRAFYKWELVENLRERRAMREEDIESKQRRAEEKRQRAAMQSSYNITGSGSNSAASSVQQPFTDADRRRQQLKDLALERRRKEADQAGMLLEDKAGEALREIDRLERQKKQFIAEFGASAASALSGTDEGLGAIGDADLENIKRAIEVPDWLKKPAPFDDWDVKKQMAFVQFHSDIRLRNKVIEKKAEFEEERLSRLEAKSLKLFKFTVSSCEQNARESELEVICLEEECKESEADTISLRENIRKINLFCTEKGEEELHLRTLLRKKEEYARRRETELREAQEWVDLCLRRAKNRDKVKRKITSNCTFVDSSSITGFHQRFKTELLRKRLYEEYFRRTIYWIVNRAEIVATERKLFQLQERLSVNRECLDDRLLSMKRVWRSIQRKDLMRMRRSLLNNVKGFFPLHRKHLLTEKFTGWVRFYQWNRGHRDAFNMKYEVLKRQMDIQRQFKQQLKVTAPKSKDVASDNDEQQQSDEEDENEDAQVSENDKKLRKLAKYKLGSLEGHSQRPIQCQNCQLFYLEAQNNSISCIYHPEPFLLLCPNSCVNPGLTPICAAHRVRRWKCCGITKHDAAGCCRRYHSPQDTDEVYESIMNQVVKRDVEFANRIDDKLHAARKSNWAQQLHLTRQEQLYKAEDAMKEAREKVAKFRADTKLANIPL